ncbi:MAG: hypothetical protein A2558_03215 [Tenericutes bacterium RIFOXYD2_FULL_35_11]|nr:MAG: hypothetical protein A2558_03215 [Tenericutes bacterium RIFOXYD2_FULL_35_11]
MDFTEIREEHVDHIEEKERHKLPDLSYVGVFSGTYLIFQNEEGMYLVDQHAAAERVRYEHYMKVFKNPQKIRKMMLLGFALPLTDQDLSVIKHNLKALADVGFIFNENVELLEVPTWLRDEDIDLAVETVVTMLDQEKHIDLLKLRDALAKDISCKGAIKANKSLSKIEIDHLMKELQVCENPYHCPHGRPTIIKLSHYDIERMFKRVV